MNRSWYRRAMRATALALAILSGGCVARGTYLIDGATWQRVSAASPGELHHAAVPARREDNGQPVLLRGWAIDRAGAAPASPTVHVQARAPRSTVPLGIAMMAVGAGLTGLAG